MSQGSLVEKEQPLYQIDAARYEANYQSAKANLQNTRAELDIAYVLKSRYQSLIETNVILIIEFAKINFEEGMDAYDAAVMAAKQRLRTILMTSLTFILGVMPLAFASGPGSGAQNAISIGVLGGITATTILVLFFAPFFFIWVMRLFKSQKIKGEPHAL